MPNPILEVMINIIAYILMAEPRNGEKPSGLEVINDLLRWPNLPPKKPAQFLKIPAAQRIGEAVLSRYGLRESLNSALESLRN